MKSAIERSNALYKALEEYIQDGDGLYMARDVVHEEIDNFLDDIEKRREGFEMDMLALDNEIADLICDTIFLKHRYLFHEEDVDLEAHFDKLMENEKFQDGVQMIRGAIREEMKK